MNLTTKWTRELVISEALKHKSRSAFKRAAGGAYMRALDDGYLDDACAHMPVDASKYWPKDAVMVEAKKYTSAIEFMAGCRGAYRAAYRNGWLESACAHMDKNTRWTKSMVLASALRYTTKSDWRTADPVAYKHAHLNGYIDEVCSHMVEGDYGFSLAKPAVVYVMKLIRLDEPAIFKIGITNRDAKLRIRGMGAKRRGVKLEVMKQVDFGSGSDARALEKSLHAKFDEFRYTGKPILGNGNTELFTIDPLPFLESLCLKF